jgi:acetoin utilization deacetylase AcuC-like enzyme
MPRKSFAVNLHDETTALSLPIEQIMFVGQSYPHYNQLRLELRENLKDLPTIPVRKACPEDYLSVHTQSYYESICRLSKGEDVENAPRLSMECTGFEFCLPGYLFALGGMMEAIDLMENGSLERGYCFSLGGHHAGKNYGHGYCMLNPMAAAVRYAQSIGFKKVLIIDWDIHHGDGTQDIFSYDNSVYHISIHSLVDGYMAKASNLKYGTTSWAEKVGHCNIPLLDDMFEDSFLEEEGLAGKFYRADESLTQFQKALNEIPWEPDMIFIFAGFDSHIKDCGKGITNWTNQDFQKLTRSVLTLSKNLSCPVLSVQGGGYKLEVTIPAVMSHIEVLKDF